MIKWTDQGIDFTHLTFRLSEMWQETDKSIEVIMPFFDVREAINVSYGGANGWLVPNNSIPASNADYYPGQNLILNDTATRMAHLILNGRNRTTNMYTPTDIFLRGLQCLGSCLGGVNTTGTRETTIRYWSNTTSWPNGTLPVAGQDVEIEYTWNMVYDLPDSPVFKVITVNGLLTFLNSTDTHLRAKHIFVRAGEIHIGSPSAPH